MAKRKPKSEFGLITRVAKITGRSKSLVSMVNSGKVKSRVVEEALAAERLAMRAEAARC